MNTNEQRNPKHISMKMRGEDLPMLVDSRGASRRSGSFRVMQRPESKQGTKVDGSGARAHWGVARRKKKAASPEGGKEEKRGIHKSRGEGAQEGEGLPCG